MTDTISCPHCSAPVPPAAAFCTSCGQPLGAPAAPPETAPDVAPPPPPPPPAPVDDTRVDTPGLHDATQVQPAATPPPSPFAPPPPAAPPAAAPDAPAPGPWGPSSAGAPPAPPASPPTAPPWSQPAPPPATWQQPQATPPGAGYNPAASPPLGGQPWDASAPPAWGTPAPVPAPEAKGKKSPIGGIVAVIGAILTVVGVFSGWVTLDPGGNSETVTGWSLTVGDGLLKSSDPYLIVGLAAVAFILGILLFAGIARTAVRIVTVLVGLGIIGVTVANWMAIASFVTDNLPEAFKASGAIGFYLAIAGGVLTVIAGLLPAKK